jgi:hypothetical protein
MLQAKVHDKVLELEAKFDARVQQLQSAQQTLLEKLSDMEQRTVAMQLGMKSYIASMPRKSAVRDRLME